LLPEPFVAITHFERRRTHLDENEVQRPPKDRLMDSLAYAVILEPEAAGGFSVTVPAFPEVLTQGESVDRLIATTRCRRA